MITCPSCGVVCPSDPDLLEQLQQEHDARIVAGTAAKRWGDSYDSEHEWGNAFFDVVNEHDPDLCAVFLKRTEERLNAKEAESD
jgi:hypothetical protein